MTNEITSRLMKSLSFEIEATPRTDAAQDKSSSNVPVNVKVKVRKKNESRLKKGVISVTKPGCTHENERVRLASSDLTILDFDVFVEADFENKPTHKKRSNIFGRCLGTQSEDADDIPYMLIPTLPIANSQNPPIVVVNEDYERTSTMSIIRKPVKFLGKCKPGGCLDPPFGEDKYPYLPKNIPISSLSESKLNNNDNTLKLDDEIRHKSNTSNPDNSSTHKLYDKNKLTSMLDDSDSDTIITYPPSLSYDSNSDDKYDKVQRTSVSSKSRKSYNELPPSYFSLPKKSKDSRDSNKVQTNQYLREPTVNITNSYNSEQKILNNDLPMDKTITMKQINYADYHDGVAVDEHNLKTQSNEIQAAFQSDDTSFNESKTHEESDNISLRPTRPKHDNPNIHVVNTSTSPDHAQSMTHNDNNLHQSNFLKDHAVHLDKLAHRSASSKSQVISPHDFESIYTIKNKSNYFPKPDSRNTSPSNGIIINDLPTTPDYLEPNQNVIHDDMTSRRGVILSSDDKDYDSPGNFSHTNTIPDDTTYYDPMTKSIIRRSITHIDESRNMGMPDYEEPKDNTTNTDKPSCRSISSDSNKQYSPYYLKLLNTIKINSNDDDNILNPSKIPEDISSHQGFCPESDNRTIPTSSKNLETKDNSFHDDKPSHKSVSPDYNTKNISPNYIKPINTMKHKSSYDDNTSPPRVSLTSDIRNLPEYVEYKNTVTDNLINIKHAVRSISPTSDRPNLTLPDYVGSQNNSLFTDKKSYKSVSPTRDTIDISTLPDEREDTIKDSSNHNKPSARNVSPTSDGLKNIHTLLDNVEIIDDKPSRRSVSPDYNTKNISPNYIKPINTMKHKSSYDDNTSPPRVSLTSDIRNLPEYVEYKDTVTDNLINIKHAVRSISPTSDRPNLTLPDYVGSQNNSLFTDKKSYKSVSPTRDTIDISTLPDEREDTIKDSSNHNKPSARNVSPTSDGLKNIHTLLDNVEIIDDKPSRRSVSSDSNKKYVSPDNGKLINTIKNKSNYNISSSRRSISPNCDSRIIPTLPDNEDYSTYAGKLSRSSISPDSDVKMYNSPEYGEHTNTSEHYSNYDKLSTINKTSTNYVKSDATTYYDEPSHRNFDPNNDSRKQDLLDSKSTSDNRILTQTVDQETYLINVPTNTVQDESIYESKSSLRNVSPNSEARKYTTRKYDKSMYGIKDISLDPNTSRESASSKKRSTNTDDSLRHTGLSDDVKKNQNKPSRRSSLSSDYPVSNFRKEESYEVIQADRKLSTPSYTDKQSRQNFIIKRHSKSPSDINSETKYSETKISSLDYAKSVNTIKSRQSTSPVSDSRKSTSTYNHGKYYDDTNKETFMYDNTYAEQSIDANEHYGPAQAIENNYTDDDNGINYDRSLLSNDDDNDDFKKSGSTSSSKDYTKHTSISSKKSLLRGDLLIQSGHAIYDGKTSQDQKSISSKSSTSKSPIYDIESDISLPDNTEFSPPRESSSKRNSIYEDYTSRKQGGVEDSAKRNLRKRSIDYTKHDFYDNLSQTKSNVSKDKHQNIAGLSGSFKDVEINSKQQSNERLEEKKSEIPTYIKLSSQSQSQKSPSGAGVFAESNEIENAVEAVVISEFRNKENSHNIGLHDDDISYENISRDRVNVEEKYSTGITPKLKNRKIKTPRDSVSSRTFSYNTKVVGNVISQIEQQSSSQTPDPSKTALLSHRTDGKPVGSSELSSESVQKSIALRTDVIRSLKPSSASMSLNSSLNQSGSSPLIIDFAFETYTDNKKRTLKTLDSSATGAKKYSKNNLSVVRTVIKNGEEVRIPIDNNNDMVVKLKRSRSPDMKTQIDFAKSVSFSINGEEDGKMHYLWNEKSSKGSLDTLSMVYERQLLPLSRVMEHVKEEMEILAKQRSILKDKLISGRVMKPRLTFSNKRCNCFKNKVNKLRTKIQIDEYTIA